MLNVATPGPVPAAADVNEIQGAPLLAFHAHEGPVVTVTVSASPPPPAVNAPGLTLKVQAAAVCATLKRRPAAVIVALR